MLKTIDKTKLCVIIVNVLIILERKAKMDQEKLETYKSTMRKMLCVSRLHHKFCERNISKMNIHHSQHHLLMYIAKKGEITSQKEIAERFEITPAAVARSLKALETEGFIERENLKDDGRFNRIKITSRGKEIIENSYRIFEEIDSIVFEDFSDEEIREFNHFLEKMQAKLVDKNEEICYVRVENEKE